MYECESWTIKKAEHRRIDAFEELMLWCWRRLLRVPWTARRSNQSILKEMSPECSLGGLMFKLKLQSFVHLMQRADSFERPRCWERLRAGREGDERGWDGWVASPTQWTWVWVDSGSWWWTGRPGVLWFTGSQGQTWLGSWTELKPFFFSRAFFFSNLGGNNAFGNQIAKIWKRIRMEKRKQNSSGKTYLRENR